MPGTITTWESINYVAIINGGASINNGSIGTVNGTTAIDNKGIVIVSGRVSVATETLKALKVYVKLVVVGGGVKTAPKS